MAVCRPPNLPLPRLQVLALNSPLAPWAPLPCSNLVPSFKLDSDQPIDLRGMPPAVAEVYVLTGAQPA